MPKKAKRTGYYYFVQDMMENKKKSGIVINITDAFIEASEPWRVRKLLPIKIRKCIFLKTF